MKGKSFMVDEISSNTGFLRKFQFSNLSNWSVQYLLEGVFSYNDKYDFVPIGDFLTRNKTPIDIEDGEEYKRVTIKINNGGVFLRDVEKGKNIGTKKQFLISTGQFLLSKIDARNGAFGVVPKEVDNAIITGNFWTFDVDYKKINPHFLALMTTTPEFIRFCQNASNGTTNRHYLQESLFLDQRIPLPSLKDQERILAAYNEKIAIAETQEREAKIIDNEIENYLFDQLGIKKSKESKKEGLIQTTRFSGVDRWSYDYILKFLEIESTYKGKYPLMPLKNFMISYQYGLSEKAHVKQDGIPMLRMNNILDSELVVGDLKYLSNNLDSIRDKFLLKKGDLLFNRTNSKELVGKTAVFNLEGEYTFASYLIRVVLDENKVDTHYINYLFNSSILQYQKDLTSRQITGQANINSKEMQDFIFPIPPIEEQKRIANKITAKKEVIKSRLEDAQINRENAIKNFENEIFQID